MTRTNPAARLAIAAPAQEAAPEPIIQLSDKWRIRDDGQQWVLQHLESKSGLGWNPESFWTYRAWLLRAIVEAKIPADEGGLAKIRALPAAHPSRGLSATFDVDAFVSAADEGRLDLDRGRIVPQPPKPSAEVVDAINWYREYRAAWLAKHSLLKP